MMRYKWIVLILLIFATSCKNEDQSNKKNRSLTPEEIHALIYFGEHGEDLYNIEKRYFDCLKERSIKTKDCGHSWFYDRRFPQDNYPRYFYGASEKSFVVDECTAVKNRRRTGFFASLVWHDDPVNIEKQIENGKGIRRCDIGPIKDRCFTFKTNNENPKIVYVVSYRNNVEYEIEALIKDPFSIDDLIGCMEKAIEDFYDERKKEHEGPKTK